MDFKEPERSLQQDSGWSASSGFNSALGEGHLHAPMGSAADGAAAVLQLCQVGVALRVIVGVQLVLAISAVANASGARQALGQWSLGALVGMPATLVWLILGCAAHSRLQRWPVPGLWTITLGAAAVLGALAQLTLTWVLQDLRGTAPVWGWGLVGPSLAGVGCAAATLYWLGLRARGQLPAHVWARLEELQARIRPHFLFNTLNAAIALVRTSPAQAEQVLEDLAELFRQALVSPSAVRSLSQEVELARKYLEIEQLRFGERLHVSWQVDPSTLDVSLPALVLQPLVENAVRHGVETTPGKGWIVIQSWCEDQHVVVCIRNAVAAAPASQTSPSPCPAPSPPAAGHGMALRNVRQRLRLLHDLDAGFDAGLQCAAQPAPLQGQAWQYVVRLSLPRFSAAARKRQALR